MRHIALALLGFVFIVAGFSDGRATTRAGDATSLATPASTAIGVPTFLGGFARSGWSRRPTR